ncbi:hypothetical protein R533_17390 [Salmonella enterica subsp. houtenae serovar 40:z4,z32:-]|nr:hypothetical protein [Salmonella enterica]ECE6508288.1 hypothetical protein [Salmonella enterica subsp. houtenae]OSD42446.1 hypothetical protein R533_17390 [Salmonella enterica subsp. houtenae serovar 40:z4,z32:-]EAN0729725.1 hypothetical protein [Salmonella enterica]EAP8040583.1 hypothetical protein [Salmonella enterica]
MQPGRCLIQLIFRYNYVMHYIMCVINPLRTRFVWSHFLQKVKLIVIFGLTMWQRREAVPAIK